MTGIRNLVLVWAALLALLGLTVTASFYFTGALSAAASLGVALTKAGLVLWFFMHLREEGGLLRVVAMSAAVWLLILLLLLAGDYATRGAF